MFERKRTYQGRTMNPIYLDIHLIVNHIPILGVAFVALLLLIALFFKNTFMQKVSLWFLVGCAVFAAVALLSGKEADHLIKSVPDISPAYLHAHEQIADLSTYTVWFTGGLALIGLLLSK